MATSDGLVLKTGGKAKKKHTTRPPSSSSPSAKASKVHPISAQGSLADLHRFIFGGVKSEGSDEPSSLGSGGRLKGSARNVSFGVLPKLDRTARLNHVLARRESDFHYSDSDDEGFQPPPTEGHRTSRLLSTFASGPLSALARQLVTEINTEHRAEVYARKMTMLTEEHQAVVAQHEEDEKYREYRRVEAQEAPKRVERHERQCKWFCIIYSVAPIYILTNLARRVAAGEVLRKRLFPVWIMRFRIFKRRRQRTQLALEMAKTRERPAPEKLQQHKFFEKFPKRCLANLVATIQPTFFRAGDFVMQEGDHGEMMYFIDTGTVEVIVKKTNSQSKSRAKGNGFVVATLTSGAYFGEFALLTDEPRMASIQCVEDTFLWGISRSAFRKELDAISQGNPVQAILIEIADQRRLQNMKKLYPLRIQQLKAVELFSEWPEELLQAIMAKFTPYVAHMGDVVVKEDELGNALYILGCGKARALKKERDKEGRVVASSPSTTTTEPVSNARPITAPGPLLSECGSGAEASVSMVISFMDNDGFESTTTNRTTRGPPPPDYGTQVAVLNAGDMFGEVACLFLEPRCATVQCITNCDMWRLSKSDLMDFMLTNVMLFLQAKEITNRRRAKWIPRLPLGYIAQCSYLQEQYGEKIHKLTDFVARLLKPKVVAQSDTVLERGSTTKSIYFILSGEVTNGEIVLRPGQCIIPDVLSTQRGCVHEYRALSRCDLWVLVDTALQILLDKFPPERRVASKADALNSDGTSKANSGGHGNTEGGDGSGLGSTSYAFASAASRRKSTRSGATTGSVPANLRKKSTAVR